MGPWERAASVRAAQEPVLQRRSPSDSRSHPHSPAPAPPSWPRQWQLQGGCAAFWQGEEGGEDEEVPAGLGPGLLPLSLFPGLPGVLTLDNFHRRPIQSLLFILVAIFFPFSYFYVIIK